MNLRVLTQKYTCGGCTVCCHVMGLRDLGKPFYARCEHVADKGCGIYADRPKNCQDFVCSWAAGLLGDAENWRPDRSGLLFFLRRFSDGLWLEIYEAVPGAGADVQRVDYLTRRIVGRVEKIERVVGTRLHHYGDRIGLGFAADADKYPQGAQVSLKTNQYDRLDREGARQVFREATDN
ncbi:MAG TPA: hypothetical protein VG326_18595 [Tepidisphaeraceae bacterium]|jgi:hypothetical protein|nr:hypothetical protein [Tepidisphaeraceae bacterium]